MANIPGWELSQEHHDTLNLARMGMPATVTLSTTEYRRIGLFTCPAATAFGVGYGDLRGQENAIGRIFYNPNIAGPVAANGFVRIQILDPQQRVLATVFQGRTEDLRLGAADQRLRREFSEMPEAWFTQDYSIELQMMGDAASLLTLADSVLLMSMTQARARRTS